MGEQIPFPLNFKRYQEIGEEALLNEKYDVACENFENAYEMEQDFSINTRLVYTLLQIHQVKRALKVANEMKTTYFSQQKQLPLLIETLLLNKYPLEARKALRFLSNNKKKREFLERIVQLERALALIPTIEMQEQRKWLNSFETMTGAEQLTGLSHVNSVPVKIYLESLEPFLEDSDFHPLVRAAILETLVELKLDKSFVYLTYKNRKLQIVPAELETISESTLFGKMNKTLADKLLDSNPTLYSMLKEELYFQFAIIYPRPEQYVLDVDSWVEALIERYTGSQSQQEPLVLTETIQEIELLIQTFFYS
ncbi:hypothetical protein ACFFIF_03925 [Vagococcus entomophilus]|uniref:Hydrolase n=1 Tax=Vagococcus entomophilus TaxID=1160095 RepID=A0A430AJ05_9ENTE|nr:hypothetical protein [Vagococcus entomophilus]RSU08071.1 hypothetical protein CBF30_02170 [Vagococcus entomophilus]